MRPLADVFDALARSSFRQRQRLGPAERAYLEEKGMDAVLRHAEDFVARRLAPALPARDGKQTPWRGHPVFVAQHATATCCRGCLQKYHDIPKGAPLTDEQQAHVIAALEHWLRRAL